MKKIILFLIVLSVLAAACSTSQPEAAAQGQIKEMPLATQLPTSSSKVQETTVDSISAGAAEHIVKMKGFKFVPSDITVSIGDTVTWINEDSAPHTATANNDEFDSDRLEDGDHFSFTFDKQGDFSYFCNIHRGMKGNIKVE